MVALTYGDTRVATPATAAKSTPKTAKPSGFLARFFAAMTEARMAQARREIALYAPHVLPLVRENEDNVNTPHGGI